MLGKQAAWEVNDEVSKMMPISAFGKRDKQT